MKKITSIFGVLVVAFGVLSAFAFKPSNLVGEAFLNSSTQCQTTSQVCNGDARLCQLDIPEDAPNSTPVNIYNFQQGSSCGTQKRMN